MTGATLVPDLIAWSAQAACIAILGGLLPVVLRFEAPGVRYAYYRALLGVCLVLPWIQGRHIATVGVVTDSFTAVLISVPVAAAPAIVTPGFSWQPVLLVVIALGVLVRAAWIAVGLRRLTHLRIAGFVAPWCREHDDLQYMLRTRAEIRYVEGLPQPVTFGLRRPLVLLPVHLRAHAPHIQRAVLSHELIHVQRRDWLWLLLEEGVRAVLWFHPVIWWLVSRIQLAREEAVDELAVLATGTRRGYIEALATFADETPLVPAAAFARRRHLFRRMRLVAKEAVMSSRRILWSCTLMAVIVAAGTWYTVGAFPMKAAAAQDVSNDIGPLEKQAKPITPDNPVPRRTYSVDPVYPAEAAAVDANAMVTVMITLDQFGRVAEIRRLGVAPIGKTAAATPGQHDPKALVGAFDSLVTSAADAIRQWTYDPPAEAPISIRVTYAFFPDGQPRLVAHDGWSLRQAGQSAWFGTASGGSGAGAFQPPPPPPPPPPGDSAKNGPWSAGAIRVGGAVLAPTKTKHVSPVYPAAAQNAKVQGVVILDALIGVTGKITNARVLRSVPLLDQAALDAVMQWEFTPTRLNGELVPVLMTVTVQFTLN